MSDISFFKERKLKQHEMNEVCGGLEYSSKPKNAFVIRYGEIGDLFYIILKGRVSVWVPMMPDKMRRPIQKFKEMLRNKTDRPDDFKFPVSHLKEVMGHQKSVEENANQADDSNIIQPTTNRSHDSANLARDSS